MTSPLLPNYLRAHRKRLALSQDEMAFLLGMQDGTNVSRNERFARVPSLEAALAYEVIHGKPARELFAGLFENIEQEVTARAATLAKRQADKPGQRVAHQRTVLSAIATRRAIIIQTS